MKKKESVKKVLLSPDEREYERKIGRIRLLRKDAYEIAGCKLEIHWYGKDEEYIKEFEKEFMNDSYRKIIVVK